MGRVSRTVQMLHASLEQRQGLSRYPKRGRQHIHRQRAEQALGKPLPPGAVVHHADGSRNPTAPLVICQDTEYHWLLHLRAKVYYAGGDPNTERWCNACQQCRDADLFPLVRSRGKQPRVSTCQPCLNQQTRDYIGKNREDVNRRKRETRQRKSGRILPFT